MKHCKINAIIATLLIFFLSSHIGFSQKGDDVNILIQNLKDKDITTQSRAARSLGDLKDPRAVEPLIAALKEKDSNLRWAAVQALVKIGTPTVDPLIAALKDEYPEVRRNAARALGEIKDPRAVEPLIAALKDRDSRVRSMVVYALGCIKDVRTVEPLVAVMLKDKDRHIRNYVAITALQNKKDSRIAKVLITALKDDESWIRRNAAHALRTINNPSAVEPLIAVLTDENPEVRGEAARALGTLKDPQAVKPLTVALKDENPDVRKEVIKALGDIKDTSTIELLVAALGDKAWGVRERAGISLKGMGPAGIEALIVALKDENPAIRMNAAYALRLGSKEEKDRRAVHKALITALKDKDLAVVAGAHFYYIEECLPKFLKRGIPGVEATLIESLDQYGVERMAENFLNHGSKKLHKAARSWAENNGYEVHYWGTFYNFYDVVSKKEK